MRCDPGSLGHCPIQPTLPRSAVLEHPPSRIGSSARQLPAGAVGAALVLVPVPPLGVVGVPCWNPLPRALYPPADGDGGTHVWKARLFSFPLPPSSSSVDCSEFRGLR